ncbi:aspartate dehydrogenase [Bacillus marinisedimentorum]|uniref:aspartate dehydrogenase n=1 Tax=Bacillus marinisedimentorum TaxID=1821260 RepID=UPI0007DFFE56|nr:aspartate dehydrogenase [Bacillus marinisedimentorum]
MLSVGLIGFGAIGKDVLSYIGKGKAGSVQVNGILVNSAEKHLAAGAPKELITDDTERFFNRDYDFIIESAGHGAVRQFAEKALIGGSHFITVSVGAFTDEELYERITAAAESCGRKLIMPSAAIGGLDRIAAAALSELDEVTLVTRKPPAAWRGTIAEEKVNLDTISDAAVIYEGTARESAKMFPKSTNVSAALSLSGIGFDRTKVKVLVDPSVKRNTHQIIAKGFFGEVTFEIQNKVLRDYSPPVVIGV